MLELHQFHLPLLDFQRDAAIVSTIHQHFKGDGSLR
jgi:hypothetical protein